MEIFFLNKRPYHELLYEMLIQSYFDHDPATGNKKPQPTLWSECSRFAATRSIDLQNGMPRCGKGSTPLLQHCSAGYCDSGIFPHGALKTTINTDEAGDLVCNCYCSEHTATFYLYVFITKDRQIFYWGLVLLVPRNFRRRRGVVPSLAERGEQSCQRGYLQFGI
jgi:hypothetical protein